jgi:hypothetical protein
VIEDLDFVFSAGIQNPKQVSKEGLEDSRLEFMEQIGDEHLVEVEPVFKQSLRKCVLNFHDVNLGNSRNIQEDSRVLE